VEDPESDGGVVVAEGLDESLMLVVIDGLDEFLAAVEASGRCMFGVGRFFILNIPGILFALLGALMYSVVSAGQGAVSAAQGSCPAKQ
jgi:hypothetical protein